MGVTSPTPTPSSATPPYTIEGDNNPPQPPGTIWIGTFSGDPSEKRLEPYLTFPEGGLTISVRPAYGAYWGDPVGASRIRISLYRVSGGTLDLVWSDVKSVDPDATGLFDDLVPFASPGTYRLEITNGSNLLAWGIARMGPKCGGTRCSGG
ncbi:MAG: hypothetical protein E4H24_04580 [Thermomicrobiales bacterium]|nr:MAG: hypothetical protein E4H24_04580 [Thermomicrobiales bacterium]